MGVEETDIPHARTGCCHVALDISNLELYHTAVVMDDSWISCALMALRA